MCVCDLQMELARLAAWTSKMLSITGNQDSCYACPQMPGLQPAAYCVHIQADPLGPGRQVTKEPW